jgi:(E)-4-hydroxy-3-methylbut-2-enyl-diphosphate synthase
LEIDLFKVTRELEEAVGHIKNPIKIALLGCVVNGPGEASEADIGIAAGKGVGILYRKGEMIRRIREDEIVATLIEEVTNFEAA